MLLRAQRSEEGLEEVVVATHAIRRARSDAALGGPPLSSTTGAKMPETPQFLSGFDYRFRDPELLTLALTHSSTGSQRNNERLEFLGDAVLDLLVAEELYRNPVGHSEGAMTEIKARHVSRPSLAAATHRLNLEPMLSVGAGLAGRALPRSLLANVFEALLGAIYLDGGIEEARRFVREAFGEEIADAGKDSASGNPKQEFQQLCQKRWRDPPEYALLEQRGQSHARAFLVAARAGGRGFPSAWGRTRKEAERWAAYEALLVLAREESR